MVALPIFRGRGGKSELSRARRSLMATGVIPRKVPQKGKPLTRILRQLDVTSLFFNVSWQRFPVGLESL